MQIRDVLELRKAWKKKGDPPCDHPDLDREYFRGSNTGDWICTSCGRVVDTKETEKK